LTQNIVLIFAHAAFSSSNTQLCQLSHYVSITQRFLQKRFDVTGNSSIVDQGTDTVQALAALLMTEKCWSFWWD